MSRQELIDELLESINMHKHFGENTAHIEIHGNKVLGSTLVEGLYIDVDETEDGINAEMRVERGYTLENPVHLCFGMIPEDGIQRINMNVLIEEEAHAQFLAHCTFPNAKNVEHLMNAEITVEAYGSYSYFERHVHGQHGGVKVIPKASILLHEGALFSTEFELLKGRVGLMDIDYTTEARAHSVLEMKARISGREDDVVKIREAGKLTGEYARGVLISHIALQDQAYAEIYNDLTADAPFATGHVDCKEIVQNNAVARAVPIVQVNHPKAHVTHEAAIGSVDSKQLQTLMARGMEEEEAVNLIIEGLLK
jgi:Fe-S cluster assembly scaffold protein SufB